MVAGTIARLSRWDAAISIYAVVSVVALAGLLFTPGTVGHHWDWLMPADPVELRRLAEIQGSSWQDYDFGSYVTYRYATILNSVLFGLPGYLGLNGGFASKTLVLLSVFVSGLGMRFLLLSLCNGRCDDRDAAVATFGGLLYALGPYAYNQIVAGDQSALISDALSPIAVGLAVRATCARESIWLACMLGSSLLLGVIIGSVQVFVFTVGVMWVACLAVRWSFSTAARLAALTAVAIALCSFWLLPTLLAGRAVSTVVQTSPIDTAIEMFGQFSNPLLTVTMLAYPADFYAHALGRGAALFFAAYGALLSLYVVAALRLRSRLLLVLGVVFLLTAVVPLGGNPVIGPAILSVFRALLPYSLFLRTPQHLMFIIALVLPMMVFLSARVISGRLLGPSIVASVAILIAYGQGFFFHSNFFGLVGPFRESAGERATVSSSLAPGSETSRTLFVPNFPSFYFHRGIFDYYFEGADDPQVRFFPGITMGAGQKWTPYVRTQQLLKALDELVPDGADTQTQNMLLQMTGVQHIIIHQIGTPTAGVRLAADNRRGYLEAALRRTGLAVLEGAFDDRSIWRVDRAGQRIYAPDCVLGVPPDADPYDVLALAPAVASCTTPATISAGKPSARSEQIISAETLRATPDGGLPTPLVHSNVAVQPDIDDTGFFAVVPPRTRDVFILRVPPMPANATGVSFRLYSSAPRRVLVQLYSPDAQNYYQTNVDFAGQVLDVRLSFRSFGSIGHPQLRKATYLHFASVNAQSGETQMYFSDFRWLDRPSRTTAPRYLSVTGNLWDAYYFGAERRHVIFRPSPGFGFVHASLAIPRNGQYDVVARAQERNRDLSIQAAVDGKAGLCSVERAGADKTERLIRLVRLWLPRGVHSLALRFCNHSSLRTTDEGVQSLIVASARLAPPAVSTVGSVRVLDQRPGMIRLAVTGSYIVFTDSYDDRWTAQQSGSTLPHVLANGYANGWLLPRLHAGDVVLRFWPQVPFDFGIAISLSVACVCLLAIGVIVMRAHGGASRESVAGLGHPNRP